MKHKIYLALVILGLFMVTWVPRSSDANPYHKHHNKHSFHHDHGRHHGHYKQRHHMNHHYYPAYRHHPPHYRYPQSYVYYAPAPRVQYWYNW